MINRVTLGTAAWNRTFVMGTGADENIEIITTKTSGRAGGESFAKWNRTRRLCLSKIVTGNKQPVTDKKKTTWSTTHPHIKTNNKTTTSEQFTEYRPLHIYSHSCESKLFNFLPSMEHIRTHL